ncbi:hypothetical protein ACFWHR_10145 [Leucobacter sp. NPDC058333]|uniref:hypothetical protein n=1 Tax=Leucobacter sp. NPDC058333 TaxID=3346450 RepID=UPI00365B69DF
MNTTIDAGRQRSVGGTAVSDNTGSPASACDRTPLPALPLAPLPALLASALTDTNPGSARPPGPRMNAWLESGATPVADAGVLGSLLGALWRAGAPHRTPDGAESSILRRPIPSAGATYAVHTHVVVGGDRVAGLEPGRYVFDHERSQLLRRGDDAECATHTSDSRGSEASSRVIFSVQPGRSFGRYRHRAWPLWIADTAYAHEALAFTLDRRLRSRLGPSAELRSELGVPRGSETAAWLDRGLVPEIPLVSIELPERLHPDPIRERALARRRSPAIAEYLRNPVTSGEAVRVARLSAQPWVAHADHVHGWSISPRATASQMYAALWHAHRAAARMCYLSARSGRRRCRPVSGFAAQSDTWMMHAVAILEGATEAEEPAA